MTLTLCLFRMGVVGQHFFLLKKSLYCKKKRQENDNLDLPH